MAEIVVVGGTDAGAISDCEGGVKPADAATLARHAPDEHYLLRDGRRLLARCSAWWRATPRLNGGHVGAIGHYAALDETSGARVIEAACARLRAGGVKIAVAPMDGNTWRSYRFVTDRGEAPPFLLEPWQPQDWPFHFTRCGFAPLATYHSALSENLSATDPRADAAAARLERDGIRIRHVRMSDFEHELRRIHALSTASFTHNFLYTPLEESEFLDQYRPVQPYVLPELVLIAEREGEIAGYLFALPNWDPAHPRSLPPAVIVKTVAVAPGRRHAGLGVCLVARAHEVARGLGFSRAIHALMHDRNNSTNVSRRYTRVMRRYTLYARALAAAP